MVGRFELGSSRVLGLPMDFVLTSVVGILALAIVMGGNVYIQIEKAAHPGLYAPPPEEEENYVYEEQHLSTLQGWTDEGTTSDQALGALPGNVTAVRMVLAWTDDIGTNDVLGLAISLNGTEMGSAEGGSGSIELGLTANDTGSEDGLMSGELGAAITAVSCPGRIGPLPRDLDTGNDWTLEVYVTVRTGA